MKSVDVSALMTRSGVGFGTSGARGLVEAMSDEVCYTYTSAFLQHLQAEYGLEPGSRVAVAGDLRPSTPRIMAACMSAVLDFGCLPENCGFVPSPAVASYAMQAGIPSIMVTGSHIPDDRNGIKYNTANGEIAKTDEAGIRAQRVDINPEHFHDGQLFKAVHAPATTAAEQHFIARFLTAFPDQPLAGLRIGVYQHTSVARDMMVTVLEGLGAAVTPLARATQFVPVDTEAIRAEDVELARQWSQEHGFDAIVTTDGDGDRPLLADEHGNWLRGDVLGILVSRILGADGVATPVSCNTALEKSAWFAQIERTRIGSPYVIDGMTRLAGKAQRVVGYEANGGFLTGTTLEPCGAPLPALPTRDALLPMIALLVETKRRCCAVSALLDELPARYTASDRLQEFPTEKSRAIIASLASDDVAANHAALEEHFGALCGTVTATDDTDGLRVTFSSAEIVHLRPSGNAPEFRCYNEAASAARATELNQACMQILATWR